LAITLNLKNFLKDLTFASESEEALSNHSFQESLKFIEEHNKHSNESYKLRINKNSHFSTREFGQLFLMKKNLSELFLKHAARSSILKYRPRKVKPKFSYWNWVDKGAVTPIRDQKSCGSCYAFSIVRFQLNRING